MRDQSKGAPRTWISAHLIAEGGMTTSESDGMFTVENYNTLCYMLFRDTKLDTNSDRADCRSSGIIKDNGISVIP